ncbi:DNA translocase FtsK [Acetivibrio cellulolyticus]|uniref:DNA translocase FtsK n=1 Tax=Acetivibrio cellulolyticus TaxID=35830 RepID=UPI0001E2C6ED|nr:DNA translocase FtsK [Acetivibrio cellulolyticus]
MKIKKIQKKKYKKKQNAILKYNHEIIGILMLAFGILILLGIYFNGSIGIFGNMVKSFVLGFTGPVGLIIPPILIVYGVLVIFKKNDEFINSKLMYLSVLLLLIAALIQTGCYKELDYINMSTMNYLVKFYSDGTVLKGGGILGGIVSIPFLLLFKNLGTIIIISTIAVIDIILLTNISVASLAIRLKNTLFGAFSRVKESIKLPESDKRQDEDGVEFEPDIVMNGKKLEKSKVLDFKSKKSASEIKEQKCEDHNLEINDFKHEDENVDFIVKDLKKKGNHVAEMEKIKDSVDKEIAHKPKTNINYKYPAASLLEDNKGNIGNSTDFRNAALKGAKKLEETLNSFGVEAKVINVSRGPAVTRYELQPSPGVKVSKIVNLSDDISLNLAASGVRIEAPIPGKAAIGIEVPNKEVEAVFLKEVIESKEFAENSSRLTFALGKDISGQNMVADIGKMPHLLVAGATGSGKSVCINSIIVSLLYKASPSEVKLLMVDPKVVELGIYNGIPHLLIPVVTDPKKAAGALNWAVQEMVNRYKLFAEKGVRDIKGYNAIVKPDAGEEPLPQIVIIIDELADLMMVAPNDVEDAICRLAQMARAAGMHLVIATQRPSVDVITGVIKANIPSRIAFAVSSQIDSRTILDMAGAEKLLGKGDMLFYPVGEPKPIRVKGTFVSDKEVESVVEYIKAQGAAEYNENIIEEINSEKEIQEEDPGDNDELLPQAVELVVEAGQASVSLIQRKFKVGYARAARIVDQMEARGIVGGFEGSKPRQVLISKQQWHELNMRSDAGS